MLVKKTAKIKIIIFYTLSIIVNVYSVYMAYRPYSNYLAYLIYCFIPITILFIKVICDVANAVFGNKKIKAILSIIFIIFINILSYGFTYEQSNINGNNQEVVSKKVLSIYKNSDYYKKNPKVLVIGRPIYLYETFNTIPDEKYFATPIVSRLTYSKPYDALIKNINSKTEDIIIVSFSSTMSNDKEFIEQIYSALNNNYKSIGNTKYINDKYEVYVKANEK